MVSIRKNETREAFLLRRKEYMKKYNPGVNPQRKEYMKKWNSSPKAAKNMTAVKKGKKLLSDEELKRRKRVWQKRYRDKNKSKIAEKQREYSQLPEVKKRNLELKRIRNQNPEYRARRRKAQAKHEQKPEVKARRRELERIRNQNPEYRARRRKAKTKYRASEKGKAKEYAYRRRPEVKKSSREMAKRYSQSKKGIEKIYVYRQRSEVKEQSLINTKRYQQSEHGRAKVKAYKQRPEVIERSRITSKIYNQRPEIKAKRKAHSQRPEVKAKNREYKREYGQRPEVLSIKKTTFEHYSNGTIKCVNCGETTFEFLELNHIKTRKEMGHSNRLAGRAMYQKLRVEGYPEGLNILCSNCNWLDHLSKIRIKTRPIPQLIQNRRQRTNNKKIKQEVFTHYSMGKPQCNCCGFDNIDTLSIDHKVPKSFFKDTIRQYKPQGGPYLYRYLKRNNFPLNFQVLCRNCNKSKSNKSICYHVLQNKKYVPKSSKN